MECLQGSEGETLITLELKELFEDPDGKMDEFDTTNIPDNVLQEIFQNSSEKSEILQERNNAVDLRADDKSKLPSRFKPDLKEYINEIGNKSIQKKTHKQTTWGVKIFRGNEIRIL